jgi:hypothetical protein
MREIIVVKFVLRPLNHMFDEHYTVHWDVQEKFQSTAWRIESRTSLGRLIGYIKQSVYVVCGILPVAAVAAE